MSKGLKKKPITKEFIVKSEGKVMLGAILLSIVVFAVFILLLDASITGMVINNSKATSNSGNLFFVTTVMGFVVLMGSVLFYFLNTSRK